MSRRIFTAPAIISGIGTQKDGTIKMSVYVTELEKTFKSKKKESELNGDAKFTESNSLTFRSK